MGLLYEDTYIDTDKMGIYILKSIRILLDNACKYMWLKNIQENIPTYIHTNYTLRIHVGFVNT